MARRLGVDIGGSGIKGAPVDTDAGVMLAPRTRVETPQPARPEEVATCVRKVVESFPEVDGPIGCTFPGIVASGVIRSAANVDESWLGVDAGTLFSERCERLVVMINDADAAGIAEVRVGAARHHSGVSVVLTFGTGIGSAVFVDGTLVPNTEFGHIEMGGRAAELSAASRVREDEGLSFEEWAERVNEYLAQIERLISPALIVFGGGVSKRWDQFGHLLHPQAKLVPAQLRNDAGIVGAAMWVDQAETSNSR